MSLKKSISRPEQRIDNTFLNGENAFYIAHLYQTYLENPSQIDKDWQNYFAQLGDDELSIIKDFSRPVWLDKARESRSLGGESKQYVGGFSEAHLSAFQLIEAYRRWGHLSARLNPLAEESAVKRPELLPETYGLRKEEFNQPLNLKNVWHQSQVTLGQLIDSLNDIYCGTSSIESSHIWDRAKREWLLDRFEGALRQQYAIKSETKTQILHSLTSAEAFENYLGLKYPTAKRFGLEGCESLIAGLEQAIERLSDFGIKDIVMGMAHRGRLNVLAHILQKPYVDILAEFEGREPQGDANHMGDVKYHLGGTTVRKFPKGSLEISLVDNPSHLESVNPVVLGKVRAKQSQHSEHEKLKVIGILLHGDAAFAGQGIVAETFMLSGLEGYETKGTIHVVINNQIGFTTDPKDSRSSFHCTDIVHMTQAPVIHVNADDPESVVKAFHMAVDYRQTFHDDFVINLIGYRRAGHNETDEPSFTQPLMYKRIAAHPTVRKLYSQALKLEKNLTEEDDEELLSKVHSQLQKAFKEISSFKLPKSAFGSGIHQKERDKHAQTGVAHENLLKVGEALISLPKSFKINPKLERLQATHQQMLETGTKIDWGMAEALAFGTLLIEGVGVRLSGQDSRRGTFSQRHAVLRDQETEAAYVPLNHIANQQGFFEVIDSPLAEASVLGFEFGYSLVDLKQLVIWEAQFGDFVNGAQVIIDQYIASCETKWNCHSGLVMLLPHGYEGAGPEHSSARLERFLELSAQDNIQVVNCTTPANYFHVLRRQILRKFQKPLIIMTPKSLLRHKEAVSTLKEMEEGTGFQKVLSDQSQPFHKIRRVVLCSGKIYYDLLAQKHEKQITDVVLIRMEQLYPFPKHQLEVQLKRFPEAEIIWCQEEPQNMGAWSFVNHHLGETLSKMTSRSKRLIYVGRPEAASPATGYHARHIHEQNKLVYEALNIKIRG